MLDSYAYIQTMATTSPSISRRHCECVTLIQHIYKFDTNLQLGHSHTLSSTITFTTYELIQFSSNLSSNSKINGWPNSGNGSGYVFPDEESYYSHSQGSSQDAVPSPNAADMCQACERAYLDQMAPHYPMQYLHTQQMYDDGPFAQQYYSLSDYVVNGANGYQCNGQL